MGIVAVVGGGPAGSAAALAAIRAGAEVELYERSGPNRDKPCGDALVKESVPELRIMGIADAKDISGIDVYESRLEGANGTIWSKRHPDDCWIAPRTKLDSTLRQLAEDAGAHVRLNTTVLSVERLQDRRFCLTLRTNTGVSRRLVDAVVLAHGVNCRISRDWGVDGSPTRVPAVSRYQAGQHTVGLHFTFDPETFGPGYVWAFGVSDDSSNVGIFALDRKKMRTAMSRFDERQRGLHASEYIPRWRGAYEPLWTGRARQWCAGDGGLISCGDAAGIVDPLTGEGIGPALISGRMAGQAAVRFIDGSPGAADDYNEWLLNWAEEKYDLGYGRRRLRMKLNQTGTV